MQSPSNSQNKAIKHGEGPMLVLAGPGSGKTFVMVQRILNLISQKHISPENILVISFSKAAALELKQRFQKQIYNSEVNLLKEASLFQQEKQQVNFTTFHACFFHILKEAYHYSSKDILQEQEKREILKIILLEPGFEKVNIKEKTEEYISKISYYKNRSKKELMEKENIEFQKIFYSYNKEIHERHKLDFEDMGLLCLQLLKTRQEILEKWQKKFQYILIDEYQDINEIQFLNIQLLAGRHKNLFVVGDDDQAIYGFRGASPKYMLDFKKYYPQAKIVLLETNYRCSENIVKEAKKVIEKNKLRYKKEIKAFHRNKEAVIYKNFENRQKEYQYLGEKIKEVWQKKGIPLQETACIYRTNSDMIGLADFFVRNKIPFVMREQCNSIFRHFIALDILAYLQFFLGERRRKDFIRIMNKPLRYISRNALIEEAVSWKKLREYYASKDYMLDKIEELEKNESWINRLDLYGAIHYIRKVIGYETFLKEEIKKQGILWEEAKEVLDFIQDSAKGFATLELWMENIREYEEALQKAKSDKEGVQLITMHACKGLEFHTVFLPDCNEGKIPHKKAGTKEEIEEERRMFYVAMTRAKEHLCNLTEYLTKRTFEREIRCEVTGNDGKPR